MLKLTGMNFQIATQLILKFRGIKKLCHLFEPADICVGHPVDKQWQTVWDAAIRRIIYDLCIIYCGFNVNDRGMGNHKREFIRNLAGHGGQNDWSTSNIDMAMLGQSKLVINYYLREWSLSCFYMKRHNFIHCDSQLTMLCWKWFLNYPRCSCLELLKILQLLYGTLKTVHQLKFVFKA